MAEVEEAKDRQIGNEVRKKGNSGNRGSLSMIQEAAGEFWAEKSF